MLGIEVGISLGHSRALVAQELLHGVEICPALHQPGCECVTQGVEPYPKAAVGNAVVEATDIDSSGKWPRPHHSTSVFGRKQ
jgi:hypothetical protein